MPSRWIYVAAGMAALSGLLGVVIGANLAPDEEAVVAEAEPDGGMSNAGEVVSVSDLFDSFDRPDDVASVRALPRGPVWSAPAGTWGIAGSQAYLSGPIAGRNLAVVELSVPESTVQIQVPVVSDGAGLVFRYRDVTNYWAFVAVPAYATWAAVKVVDGREQAVATTGLSATANGTAIGVRQSGETIDLILDSRVVTTITDPELADATGVGLTARDATARLDGLRVEQPEAPVEADGAPEGGSPPEAGGAPETDPGAEVGGVTDPGASGPTEGPPAPQAPG